MSDLAIRSLSIGFISALLLCRAVFGQDLTVDRIVQLRTGTDSLVIDRMVTSPNVSIVPEGGGWLITGFQERWKWAYFSTEGELVAAPGKRWSGGGPGEFRGIEYALSLQEDTILIVEPNRLVRVLRTGQYLDQEEVPIRTDSYTRHDGEVWLSGRSAGGVFLVHLNRSGKIVNGFNVPSQGEFPSGQVISWGDGLWLWQYPRGPMMRINEVSGEVVEEWTPFGDLGDDWRATALAGPDGMLMFDLVRPGATPQREWLFFGLKRQVVWRGERPLSLAGGKPFPEGHIWTLLTSDSPLALTIGLNIYRLAIDSSKPQG